MEFEDAIKPVKKKGQKLIKADKEKKVVLPEGVTKESMKQFLESIKPKEDPEEKRKTGRPDDMQIAYEGNYFLMGENTLQIGESDNGRLGVQSWGQQRDLGYLIFEEIWTHGRKTITELVNTIQSANKHIITLVVNQMIKDDMLLNYKEEDGTETLEIVDKRERARRQRERMALEDKTPPPDVDVEVLDPDSMLD